MTLPRSLLPVEHGSWPERIQAGTVSLTDLAWALVAEDDVARVGGVLDEARVNRLRYLDGTPKASTRWIDTGWGIVLVKAFRHEEDRPDA